MIGNQGTGTEVSSTTASPRVGDNFAAPPLDPPRTNPDDASEGYMPAACRVCALAEAEGSLCDFAPRDKGWWSDAITAPQHQKISLELWSALRLQKTQRTVLTISTSHNECAINASLMTIAAAAAEAASLEAATTRDAMVESIKDDGATPRSLRKGSTPAALRRGQSDEDAAAAQAAAAADDRDVAAAANSAAHADFMSKLDPEARCPLPIRLVCVQPHSNPRTSEPADIVGGPPFTAWGELMPPVADELSKSAAKLWLHAGALDFACRTQLLESWREGSLAARRGPSAAAPNARSRASCRPTSASTLSASTLTG